MFVQPALPAKTLRVLDLASPGNAARAYSRVDRRVAGRVEVRAYGLRQEGMPRSQFRVNLQQREGRLPDCLVTEPLQAYDHVHLHMADRRMFDEAATRRMFAAVRTVMKAGGVLLISADNLFFSDSWDMATKYRDFDGMLAHNFQIIYRFADGTGLHPITSEQASGFARQFDIAELGGKKQSAEVFFSLFSKYAAQMGEYFAIAVKR